MMTCPSDGTVRLGVGLAGSAALREATPAARAQAQRPFTVPEACAAAKLLSRQHGLPCDWLQVGICLDLLAVTSRQARRTMARRIGIGAYEARAMETMWEALQPALRFELVQSATSIVLARRIGGAA
jgi:hypothetical protein